jgi:major membrane immunogen (membrane-anchored lipoprotein)
MEITKEDVKLKIKDGSFSDWHLGAQENGQISKERLKQLVDELVVSGDASKYIPRYDGEYILIHLC